MNLDEIDFAEWEQGYLLAKEMRERVILDKRYFAYLERQIASHAADVTTFMHHGILAWEPFHKSEQAIESLGKAISLEPKNTEARFWLAKCGFVAQISLRGQKLVGT